MAKKGKWLRVISANDVEAIKHYEELARINEAIMVPRGSEYAYDIYLTKSQKRSPSCAI